MLTDIELITTALAAGVSAGLTGTANQAVTDAYTGLKGLLARRLAGRPAALEALDAAETEPSVWQTRIGPALTAVGVERDEELLAAAQMVLAAAGHAPSGHTTNVVTNYGAAGTFTAPVAITNHPFPPAPPAA